MKIIQKWGCWIASFLFLAACSQASVDGEMKININEDGSGSYQFSILTHPITLRYFEKYYQQLQENQFQIKKQTKGEQVGWIATKKIDQVSQESLPMPLSMKTSSQSSVKQSISVDRGFYFHQIRVNYPLDLTQIPQESPLILLMKDRIHLRLILSLPVTFEDHNAHQISKDGKTATWNLKVGEINPIQAQVTIPNLWGWIITIIGSILLITILMIWLRKKRRTTE